MKYLTLIVIPYPGANVRSIRIKHWVLIILGVVFLVLFCGAFVQVFYLKQVFEKAGQFDRVITRNRSLALENRQVRELAERLQNIDRLVEKIQVAHGVTPATEEKSDSMAAGAGEIRYPVAARQMEYTRGRHYSPAGGTLAAGSKRVGVPSGRPMDEKSFISRNFNPEIFHFGVDFALKKGTPVKVTAGGEVVAAERNENFGLYVIVKHRSGYSTMYGHNDKLMVKKADRVKQGDIIAYSGNTGKSSGPHLHYAIFDEKNNPIDPTPYL
ncbi:MAG: M23 family metallopeptidase [Gemmatimonadota bacterium]|nr:M23 family metallopeptidase [Gemmatimonadota bacterium]